MMGHMFVETLRRNVRGMLLWSAFLAFVCALSVAFVSDSTLLENAANLIANMPPFFLSMMGGADAQFLATPVGFLAVRVFGWVMLLFCVYAVGAGMSISANDEERGSLDLLLATPAARWWIIAEKFAAYAALLLCMALLSCLATWGAMLITPTFKEANFGRLLESFLNLLPGTLLVLAFTALMGALLRRRATALGIAGIFVAGSYFIDVMGRSAEVTSPLRTISFYSYYDGVGVMRDGLVWGHVIGLLVVAAALLGLALAAFQRRDVGV